MRHIGVVLAVVLLASGCSSDAALTELAQDTCDDLDSAIVLQVGGILSGAIRDAEDLGYEGPDLGDKMREDCPDLMAAMESIGEEQEARDNLPNEMRVVTERCSSDGASGTVTNESELTVDIFIGVNYLDSSGVIIADGLDSVDRIRPGETANWEDERFESLPDLDICRAEVSSVFES
jgi:hypothetical protein